jgi:hypothetical protein
MYTSTQTKVRVEKHFMNIHRRRSLPETIAASAQGGLAHQPKVAELFEEVKN